MNSKNLFYIKLHWFQATIVIAALLSALSCNNYENPGNNSGKTGDGTGMDSLKTKRSDTGKGANQLNLLIRKKGDSIN